MDKELSVVTVLLVAVIGAISAFLAARYMPRLLLAVIPVVGIFFVGHLLEVTDSYVGPAIAAEAGMSYIVVSWDGPLIVFINAVVGLAMRRSTSNSSLCVELFR